MKNDILNLIEAGNGYIRTRDAKSAGISDTRLRRMAQAGQLERVAHGLYMSSDYFPDAFVLASYRCPTGIFSHDTALYLHDLSDRVPFQLTMTIPSGSTTRLLKSSEMKFYYCKSDLINLYTQTIETPMGNKVPVYDKERTLCDCVYRIETLDRDLVLSAIKEYLRSPYRDNAKLLKAAEVFRVRDEIRNYMEALQ